MPDRLPLMDNAVPDNIGYSSINNNLTLLSWNVKGLGHVIKRGWVSSHCSQISFFLFRKRTLLQTNSTD